MTSRLSVHAAARGTTTLVALLVVSCAAGPRERPAQAAPPTAPPAEVPAERACRSYGPEQPVRLSALETKAVEAVRARLSGRGARPALSGALTSAARILARQAGRGAEPLARPAIRDALALACAYDPAPDAFRAHASPDHLAETLAGAVSSAGATHIGVGVVEIGGLAVAVVLTSQRKVRLDAFPQAVEPGRTTALSGEVDGSLRSARVFVTLPSGQVQEREAMGGRTFRAPIPFPTPGRYVIEVVAEGKGGPTVAAILAVSAGGAALSAAQGRPAADPADAAEAESRVVAEISALRARHGLPPVTSWPQLAEVARRHSAAMRSAGVVAHVLPGSPAPGERLTRAGLPFRRVLENVARAQSALAAHEAAVESPAHRMNLLDAKVSRAGVGIARETLASGEVRVYLTELLVEPPADLGESRLTPDAQIREALWNERARLKLPPLTADVALDELARQGAEELRRRDAQEPPELAPRALAMGRGLAAADGFVASGPGEAAQSRNLRDPRYRRVGVGVVEGSSRRFGAGRLFIAVVYTD